MNSKIIVYECAFNPSPFSQLDGNLENYWPYNHDSCENQSLAATAGINRFGAARKSVSLKNCHSMTCMTALCKSLF